LPGAGETEKTGAAGPPGAGFLLRKACLVALGLLVAGSSGCGGPITNDELGRGIETLGATASEGRLIALGAAQNRTKVTFVRVEARALATDAEHEAEKLNDAQAQPGNAKVKDQAVKLARDIDSALVDLQISPTNRRGAKHVADKLAQLSTRADALGNEL
jgi:hypothetical protein